MKKANQYIQQFKKLETAINEISGMPKDSVSFRDKLQKAATINPFLKYAEGLILDLCSLRNIFAHADRDKYIAQIYPVAFTQLENILTALKNPPKASNVCKKNVFVAFANDDVHEVLDIMNKRIFTHVPVYETKSNYNFLGILSETTVFNWYLENHDKKLEIDLSDRKFRRYLHNKTDIHVFRPASESIFDILSLFEEKISQRKRLGCVLITKTGKSNEKPINIFTAWDIPDIKQYFKI